MSKLDIQKLRIASLVLGLGLAFVAGALAADRVTILSEGGASGFWRPASASSQPQPPYPASLADKSEDVCVSLGYMLNADGSTSDLALLTSWGSKQPKDGAGPGQYQPFTQYAAAVVKQWRFVPVDGGHASMKPVYTAASFAFTTNAATDREQLRAHCVIADLPEFIKKAQEDAYKKGNLNKGQMQRDRAQSPPVIQPPAQR